MLPASPSLATLPGLELASIMGQLLQFLFAMLRIGAFLIASPVFGGRFVPLAVRILASVALTFPVMFTVSLPEPEILASARAVPLVMVELAIGLSAGMVLSIIFGAAALAGDRIASTAGLGFAAQFDPASGGQTPVVSQIFGLFLLAIFLSLDGHLAALNIMLGSYRLVPPGGTIAADAILGAGTRAAGDMFSLGLQIMLPVVAVLLLLNLVVGVITRSSPQLNIFSFGFPMTITAASVLILIWVPGLATALASLVRLALDRLTEMIAAL